MPLPWLYGLCRQWWLRTKVVTHCRNSFTADLRDADIIFLYLFPKEMDKLAKKFDEELRPATRIVSHSFTFKDREPIEVIEVQSGRCNGKNLFR